MNPSSPPPLWAIGAGHIDFKVRLTPKSQKNEIEGTDFYGDELILKARVRAQPTEGAANRALEILCAKWLSVPKSSVSVSSGSKSRIKKIRVIGDPAILENKFVERLNLTRK